MQKKKIKAQIIKEGKAARQSLQGFMKKGDQNQLHKFRVGVKKMRAVASLIESTTPLVHIRSELKPLKETYQLSGQVRDSYLHQQLAATVKSADKKYLSDEKVLMKKATRKLRKKRPQHLRMLRRAKEQLLRRVPKIKGRNVGLFYETELFGIAGCLSSSTEVEQTHDCRKRLKVLLYNLPLVGGNHSISVDADYLQAVQTAIGDWHDHVLAAEQFPELGGKSEQLMQEVKTLTKNFYERATAAPKAQ
jgi:CHAD domain-containing protein